MRADAAPFIPSVLLNSSTYDGHAEQKTEQRSQKQRRRRQGKLRVSSSDDKTSSRPQQQHPEHNEKCGSSDKGRKQKQHPRKRRPRRKKSSMQQSSQSQAQSIQSKQSGQNFDDGDGLNHDKDCFPTLLATDNEKVLTKIAVYADGSWGESLVTKLAISEIEQQQEEGVVNYDDDFGIQFSSEVQLTKLGSTQSHITSASGYVVEEAQTIVENVIVNENDDSEQLLVEEDKTLLPNAKLKWNDTQLSKMRMRWWEAVRDKQTKDVERATKYEPISSLCRDELDDERSTSSDSSSLFLWEDEEQSPTLSRPLNEQQTQDTTCSRPNENAEVHPAVLELETKCYGTTHPLHAIIYLHALRNPFVCNGTEDFASRYTRSEYIALKRLLILRDEDDINEWMITRIRAEELFQLGKPSAMIKTLLTSMQDITSMEEDMTPLQLAIALNLPDIVRLLSSSNRTCSMGSKNASERGCTSLMLACELGNLACIKALLCTFKIKLDYREKGSGNTFYHFCCLCTKMTSYNDDDDANVSALDTMMSHTPNALRKRVLLLSNREGRNILHIACARGDLNLLKCALRHLSSVSSQLPWKALTATDRLGNSPFISAVSEGKCEIVSHILITRFSGADYSVLFMACPLTIAASNYDVSMASLLFEMGYDTQGSVTSNLSRLIKYDINRALLELMLIRLSGDEGGKIDDNNYELIRLLVVNGADPHKPVSIHAPQKPGTRGDTTLAVSIGEEETSLSAAVTTGDFESIECMLETYSYALAQIQSLRRKDPLLISQPESYFEVVEEREDDAIKLSLQSALVKALFLVWESGNETIGKCCLVLYKRGVMLSRMSLQLLEKCILRKRFVASSSAWNHSVDGYYFESQLVQYSLPKASENTIEGLNPYASVGAFMCWSQVLSALPWTNKFSFDCEWMRKTSKVNYDQIKTIDLVDDEFFLLVENERLLLHKSIISARSGKLAAAIHFMETQSQHDEGHEKLHVSVDLPLLLAKLFLCHCYHGSLSHGLVSSPLKRSEQLLELALLAEEYLCPSLLAEVEMRMLETKSNDCFCAYCSGAAMTPADGLNCPVVTEPRPQTCHSLDGCHPFGVYHYKASHFNASFLIKPTNAINVLAVAQQLEMSPFAGCYSLKYTSITERGPSKIANIDGDKKTGFISAPFLACKIAASVTLLTCFKLFMEQSSGGGLLHENGNGAKSGGDENYIILLRTCLEELANNPLRYEQRYL